MTIYAKQDKELTMTGVDEFQRDFARNFLMTLFPNVCFFVKPSIFASYFWMVYARVIVSSQTGQ